MINLYSVVLLGFLLGMRHATDPDHVIAVTTIVSRERRVSSAVLIGGLWGIGHSLTILFVGSAIIVFDVVIPPRLGLSMELSVALMLILLGVLNLTGLLQWLGGTLPVAHSHAHVHGEHKHTHLHVHMDDDHAAAHSHDLTGHWVSRTLSRLGLWQVVRPLVVGVVHGLAGSAAIALLVLTTIPRTGWAVAYLLVFGTGTVAGMMLITAANALPFTVTAGRFAHLNNYLRVASGVLSLAFGLFMAYRIGIVDGLFTGNPSWTPE